MSAEVSVLYAAADARLPGGLPAVTILPDGRAVFGLVAAPVLRAVPAREGDFLAYEPTSNVAQNLGAPVEATEFLARNSTLEGGGFATRTRWKRLPPDLHAVRGAVLASFSDRDGDGANDADDLCPTVADADQSDVDRDGLGDACDPCSGAREAVASASAVRLRPRDNAGRYVFVARGSSALPAGPHVDPPTQGVRFLLAVDGASHIDANLSPDDATQGGIARWTKTATRSGQRFAFRSPGREAAVRELTIEIDDDGPGIMRFRVEGDIADIVPARFDQIAATVVLAPPRASAGECVEMRFSAAACRRPEGADGADSPVPITCALE